MRAIGVMKTPSNEELINAALYRRGVRYAGMTGIRWLKTSCKRMANLVDTCDSIRDPAPTLNYNNEALLDQQHLTLITVTILQDL